MIAPLFLVVTDTLDDILTGSGDEEEEDEVIGKVLDEIGLEYTSKVCRGCDRYINNMGVVLPCQQGIVL